MGFWGKEKNTRKNLAKLDMESAEKALRYINTSASTVAAMAAKYHKRYLLEGSEGDNDLMAICDAATNTLKEAYEILYQVIEEEHQERTKE